MATTSKKLEKRLLTIGDKLKKLRVKAKYKSAETFAFDNDLKVDTILEPTTARQLFSNAANATKPVKIIIKNIGTVPVSGSFNVSYNYGGGTITEIINTTINAGASYIYTFTGLYPIIAAGYQYIILPLTIAARLCRMIRVIGNHHIVVDNVSR